MLAFVRLPARVAKTVPKLPHWNTVDTQTARTDFDDGGGGTRAAAQQLAPDSTRPQRVDDKGTANDGDHSAGRGEYEREHGVIAALPGYAVRLRVAREIDDFDRTALDERIPAFGIELGRASDRALLAIVEAERHAIAFAAVVGRRELLAEHGALDPHAVRGQAGVDGASAEADAPADSEKQEPHGEPDPAEPEPKTLRRDHKPQPLLEPPIESRQPRKCYRRHARVTDYGERRLYFEMTSFGGSHMRIKFTPLAVALAALAAAPVHGQGLLNKLKDRLGPAGGVVGTVIENRAAFQGFTEEEEIEIARGNAAQFDAGATLVDDPRLDALLNGIVQRLAAHAAPRPFEYRLKVVSDPNVNAFTFGGGLLYVNAGLIARMENEAQVAMVLGHEIAHAAESHVTEGMKADAGINLLGQLAGQAAAASGRIDHQVLEKTYQYSMSAAVNGHGRRQESEADELGLEYMTKAGYDPREASGTFEALLKEYGDASKREAFFYSSHPRNEERMKRADAWAEANAERFESSTVTVNTAEFQQAIHGIVVATGKYDYENERFESALAMFTKAAADGVVDPEPQRYLELLAADGYGGN